MDPETTSRDIVFDQVSSYHSTVQNNPNTILEDFPESMQLVPGNEEQAGRRCKFYFKHIR